ncbi:MAG: hypothetical protein JSS20_14575 [Proteobacteria bacterium]|nr:hypothetical protein [Pseudomonadota bacterium]
MPIRGLFTSFTADPGQLAVLFEAFDTAWSSFAPIVGDDPDNIDAARSQLANTILSVAQRSPGIGVAELAEAALKLIMR